MSNNKPRLSIVKLRDSTPTPVEKKVIQTTRDKFRSILPPFLLSVYLTTNPNSTYILSDDNLFLPRQEHPTPYSSINIYTWLDSTLQEIFDQVFKIYDIQQEKIKRENALLQEELLKEQIEGQQDGQQELTSHCKQKHIIPEDWTTCTISTLYLKDISTTKLHLAQIQRQNSNYTSFQSTLFQLALEIGDVLEMCFQ